MKKIIFLLCLVCLIGKTQTTVEADLYEQYEFDAYTIETERFGTDIGERGYYLTKVGSTPFEMTLFIDDAWVDIRHIDEIDEKIVIYGDVHYLEAETFYEAYVLILDQAGNILFEYIEDRGNLEIVDDVFMIDNVWIIRTIYAERGSRGPTFIKYFFTAFDQNYNQINEIVIDQEMKDEHVTETLYLFKYDYQDHFDGAIDEQFNYYKASDHLDIATNTTYTNSIFLPIINEATLNDETIENGHLIDFPGHYNLTYNDMNYEFTVTPSIEGVVNQGVYQEAVTVYVSSGEVYLNNDAFLSGETVTNPGNYTLRVSGINGFEESLSFQITANLRGVINEHTYQHPIQISFNGNGYLNNQYVESPVIVDEVGEYVLQVKGTNSYLETVQFTMETPPKETSWIHFVQQYDIFVFIVVGASALIYLKRK